ncbi:hypothetical protein BGZ76_001080, partial [Entomortierella beljakovae]
MCVNEGGGRVVPLLSGPRRRHGVIQKISSYADTLILLAWSPETKSFSLPIEIDLTNTYNTSIPNDLYQQYTVNGTINPAFVLDSRYNEVLSNAIIEPTLIHNQDITYFTIDYDGTNILDNDIPVKKYLEDPHNFPVSNMTTAYLSTVCPSSSNPFDPDLIPDPFDPNKDQFQYPATTLVFPTLCTTGIVVEDSRGIQGEISYSTETPSRDPNVYLTENNWGVEPSLDSTSGPSTEIRFRIASIPYFGGRGLVLQYAVIDTLRLPWGKDRTGNPNVWAPKECDNILKALHFKNTTEACRNVTIPNLNPDEFGGYGTFLNGERAGPHEHTGRYCVVKTDESMGLAVFCGTRYIKIAYLGELSPARIEDLIVCKLPAKGDVLPFCDVEHESIYVEYDDPSKPFRTISLRGYGNHRITDMKQNSSFITLNELGAHMNRVDEIVNMTTEIFLREYSLGTDRLLREGGKAKGVGYLTVLVYEMNIGVFSAIIGLIVLWAIGIAVMNYCILPAVYTSPVIDVVRVATAPPNGHQKKDPTLAHQVLMIHQSDDGN